MNKITKLISIELILSVKQAENLYWILAEGNKCWVFDESTNKLSQVIYDKIGYDLSNVHCTDGSIISFKPVIKHIYPDKPQLARPKPTRVSFLSEPDLEPQISLGIMKNWTGGDTHIIGEYDSPITTVTDLLSIGFLTRMKSIDHTPRIIHPVQITM